MGYDDRVTIERAVNGYTVSMRDPAIVAANRKRDLSDSRSPVPYRDPDRTYVFDDMKGLTAFLAANLDKALPKDDFDSSFDELTDDDESEDDD